MRVLIVDNYDSFTYNLVHQVEKLIDNSVDVIRNDRINPQQVTGYDRVILSPGPGLPEASGKLMDIVSVCVASGIPTLGVCLGHQAIGIHFGAELENMQEVHHGLNLSVNVLDHHSIFREMETPFHAGRYHSWRIVRNSMPDCLQVIAEDSTGHVMAIAHKSMPVYGVQFHPESVMTTAGDQLMKNWLYL